MIESLIIVLLTFIGISLYINETTLHKNKIKFDLLKDRKFKGKK